MFEKYLMFFRIVHIENSSRALGEITVRERNTNKQLRYFIKLNKLNIFF